MTAAPRRPGLSVREVEPRDAQLLLDWRTKPRITRFSNTDIAYDLAAQQRWLESCYDRPDYYHWIVEIDDQPAGLINLGAYDPGQRTTSWGFCIGEDSYLGLGALLPTYFYNFAFAHLGVDTISAECFYNNTQVIDLHLLHGYRFVPARDRVITKARGAKSQSILLVAMLLEQAAWNVDRYGRFVTDFPMTRWRARPALTAS